jgi:hypothetical protein
VQLSARPRSRSMLLEVYTLRPKRLPIDHIAGSAGESPGPVLPTVQSFFVPVTVRDQMNRTEPNQANKYEWPPAGTTRMSLPQSGCTYSTRTRAVTTHLHWGRNDGTCRTVEPKEERARKFAFLACSIAPIQASAGTNQEQRVWCHASSMTRVREGNHDVVVVLGGTA